MFSKYCDMYRIVTQDKYRDTYRIVRVPYRYNDSAKGATYSMNCQDIDDFFVHEI